MGPGCQREGEQKGVRGLLASWAAVLGCARATDGGGPARAGLGGGLLHFFSWVPFLFLKPENLQNFLKYGSKWIQTNFNKVVKIDITNINYLGLFLHNFIYQNTLGHLDR